MTPRIKKLFFGLIGIAILSLAWIFGYVKDFLPTNLSANLLGSSQAIPQTPLTQDSDSDGLTDRNEILYGTDPFIKDTDGDSFVDGEEVATGHDPRKVDYTGNPGIYGTEENGTPNLTNRLVNQTVANLIGDDGQINTTQYNNKTAAAIVRSTVADSANLTYVPPVTDKDIKISSDSSKDAIKAYLDKLLPIIEESQIGLTSIARQLNTINASPFDGYIFFQEKYVELKSMTVPKEWKEIHKEIITVYLKLANSSNFFNADQINEDPMKAMLMVNSFQDTIFQAQNILAKVFSRVKKEDININNSILNILNSKIQQP